MARAQVERWAQDHPTCPKTGRYLEVPLSYIAPRVLGVIGTAGLIWYFSPKLMWFKKPDTLDPTFVEEAKRVGNVAVSHGTWVWRLLLHASLMA